MIAEYEESVRDSYALIEKLTESEHRYRSVFESSATPTIIVEEDLTISMANTEFEKLSGYSRQEIEGSLRLTTFFDDDIARCILEQTDDEQGQEDFLKREFRFLDKQGTKKDVIAKVGKITGAQRYVCSLVDITPRKRME
ncbi:MAG TPA: PAS domain S-box protein, partial [Deltaproteobacteria bacterium]|nr:PAS domain S-box protein [Deltaproteobacteria bacterium]